MEWIKLKKALLNLPIDNQSVFLDRIGTITNSEVFLRTQIAIVDKYPQISPRTLKNNLARKTIAKPAYDRLYAYYLIKTRLI